MTKLLDRAASSCCSPGPRGVKIGAARLFGTKSLSNKTNGGQRRWWTHLVKRFSQLWDYPQIHLEFQLDSLSLFHKSSWKFPKRWRKLTISKLSFATSFALAQIVVFFTDSSRELCIYQKLPTFFMVRSHEMCFKNSHCALLTWWEESKRHIFMELSDTVNGRCMKSKLQFQCNYE